MHGLVHAGTDGGLVLAVVNVALVLPTRPQRICLRIERFLVLDISPSFIDSEYAGELVSRVIGPTSL